MLYKLNFIAILLRFCAN